MDRTHQLAQFQSTPKWLASKKQRDAAVLSETHLDKLVSMECGSGRARWRLARLDEAAVHLQVTV